MKALIRMGMVLAVLGIILTGTAWASDLTIGNYTLVNSKRVSRFEYEYTYKADVTNTGGALKNVMAEISSVSPYTIVVEGVLEFGDVLAGSSVVASDTFVIKHNRRYPMDWSTLTWVFHHGEAVNLIGPDGGVLEVTDPNSNCLGAKIIFPPDVVESDSVISISQADIPDDPQLMSLPLDINSSKPLNSEFQIVIPLKEIYHGDTTFVFGVNYNEVDGLFESTGLMSQLKSGDRFVTLNSRHLSIWSTKLFTDVIINTSNLRDVISIAQSYREAFKNFNCIALDELRLALYTQQEIYWNKMEDLASINRWCTDFCLPETPVEFIANIAKDQIETLIAVGTSQLVASYIWGTSAFAAAQFTGAILAIPTVAWDLTCGVCIVTSSWVNPGFWSNLAGYYACDLYLRILESDSNGNGIADVCESDSTSNYLTGLYILDSSDYEIHFFESIIDSPDLIVAGNVFQYPPVDFAFDQSGNMLVVESNIGIHVFEGGQDNYSRTIHNEDAQYILVDNEGLIYVSSQRNATISVYDVDYSLIDIFSYANVLGRHNNYEGPHQMALDPIADTIVFSTVWAATGPDRGLLEIDKDGTILSFFGPGWYTLTDCDFGVNGNLYVWDGTYGGSGGSYGLRVFNSSRQQVRVLFSRQYRGSPRIDFNNEHLYVSDYFGGKVDVYEIDSQLNPSLITTLNDSNIQRPSAVVYKK